jgi:cation diffusion facilitator family transporter
MTPNPGREATRIGVRSTLVGVLANSLLAAAKGIAGIAGNSYALVADAIESAFDVLSSLVVLGGLRIAARPADEDHPYGHGKAEPLAAMAVAIALCTAAISIAIQSIQEIVVPHHAPAPFTLVVLILVVLIKEILFRFVLSQGERAHSTAVTTDAWHHRSDAFTSAAAFIGISVALIGGEGFESADDIAALAASGLIGVNGVRLLTVALREVMDAAPPAEVEAAVRLQASRVPGVAGLDKCFVRKMGLAYFVDLHVEVVGEISVRDGHEIAHRVKDAVRLANPMIADVLVHIEPAPLEKS